MEKQDYHKALFNLNPTAIYIWKEIESEFRLIDFNNAALEITGGKVKDFKGISLNEMYSNEPEILNDFKKCLNLKKNITRNINYKYKSTGKEKVLEVSYNFIPPNNVFVFTKDITKQNSSESSLRKSEREKALILGSIAEHVVYQDTNHNIIWTNKAAANSVKMKVEDLIGKKCYKIWCNPDGPIKECPIGACLKEKVETEAEVKTPDGRIWYIKGYPVFDENNKLIGAVEVTNEITQLRYTQIDLKKSEKKNREAYNRARFYKDLFAHDMNNILQNILSSAELLALIFKNYSNIEEINSLITIIMEQLKRGSKLASNVRKLSDLDDAEIVLDKIDIIKILKTSKKSIIDAYPHKNIQIKLNSEYSTIHILADDLVNEVFENILNNSVHHNNNLNVDILINVFKKKDQKNNFIKLEIIDNGIGIPDEDKQKVFIRGDSEIDKLSGSGLGLKLVKKLVDNYNVKIWIEDKIKGDHSKGSKFVLLFPEAG